MKSHLSTKTEEPHSISRNDGMISFSLGLIAFVFYVQTLLPGLVPNDGAEFQTLAYVLDHAHTTGYHVYLVLARLFTFIPLGDIAYRVNLFSAFMGAVTIALTYLSGKILSGNRWGAGLAASSLAISSRFWSQAILAEVYTAGTAFFAAILFFLLLWYQTRNNRYLFICGLLGGMGIGIHGSVILLAPAITALFLMDWKTISKIWKPALIGNCLGIIILIIAFILVDFHEIKASMMNTYISSASRWDLQPEQLDTQFERFSFLVFARQWRSEMFVDPLGVIPHNYRLFLTTVGEDFASPIYLLTIGGLISLWLRGRKMAIFFICGIATHLSYTLNYRIGDIFVFFLSFFTFVLPLAAEGVASLFRMMQNLPSPLIRYMYPIVGGLLILLSLFPYLGKAAAAYKTGEVRFDFMSLPSNYELIQWHQSIRTNVAALPDHAVVLMDWYDIYAYIYTAQIELNRPDLLFIEAYPYSCKSEMADSLYSFLRLKSEAGNPLLSHQEYEELSKQNFKFNRLRFGVEDFYEILQK